MKNWRRYILAGACAAFLVCFLVVPIILAISSGFIDEGRLNGRPLGRTLVEQFPTSKEIYTEADRYGRFAAAKFILFYSSPLLNSLRVALVTTACVFALALPLAVLANHFDFRGKRLATAMLMAPMILPPFVGALAIEQLLAKGGGSINLILASVGLAKVNWLGGGFGGVVILETLHLYPIMFLCASAALANVDPTMIEASRNLGASRWRTFRRVTLPLIRPGLFAGGTIVFIWSFTELGTPLMMNYNQVLPVQIYNGLQVDSDLSRAPTYSMVFVMLSASVGLYAIGKVLFGRSAAATAGRGVAAAARKPGKAATAAIWLAFGGVTAVATLPHVGVAVMAFAKQWTGTILPTAYTLSNFRAIFAESQTWNSIVNSLRYASVATAVDVVLGLTVAYLVVRLKVRGRSLLDGLAIMPLAVPGLVIAGGYVALTAFEPLKAIGPGGNPTLILIIAYSVRRLPYMVRSISAGLEQTSETLEEAARNLGAGPARSVLKITVPLIAANVLAGSILAFSFAMLEVSDSLILAQTRPYYPITKQIYTLASNARFEAAALGTLAMALLAGTLLGASLLLGKRLGAMFRV